MAATTTRAALPYPALTDPDDVPKDVQALAERLDTLIAMDDQGPLGSRPAPGVRGRLYTDTTSGVTYRDNGTAWLPLNPIEQLAPSGQVAMFAGAAASVPAGWLFCDGRAVSRTTYPGLFSVVGSTWGAGDGATTFNLPDYRGVFPLGAGQGAGLTNRALAAKGGVESVLLTVAQMPSHSHGGATRPETATHTHAVSGAYTGISIAAAYTGIYLGPAGGHSHNPAGSDGANMLTSTSLSYRAGNSGSGLLLGSNVVPTSAVGDHTHPFSDPAHTHGVTDNGHTHGLGTQSATHTHNIDAQGGGGTHENMPPFSAINFMIKT